MTADGNPFILNVAVDTSEQIPWPFAPGIVTGVVVVPRRMNLDVGDYAPLDPDSLAPLPWVIERKSKADLYGSLTNTDARRREIEKIKRAMTLGIQFDYVIESSWEGLGERPRNSGANPASIRGTIRSWRAMFGTHWWTPGARAEAEKWAVELMVAWAKEWKRMKEEFQP